MENKKEIGVSIGLGLLVLLSRLPFISIGFGSDADAWRVANIAHLIADSGKYVLSRFPGFPFQEITYSFIYNGFGFNPLIFNGLTVLFSVAAVILFYLCLRILEIKQAFLISLTFAFVPVVYIASCGTLDAMWAACFIMAGFYAVLKKRFLLGGVFLGFAIGCRISSGLMLIPLSFLMTDKDRFKNIIKFNLAALLTGLALFIPVIDAYGLSFLRTYDSGYLPIILVLYNIIFGVWGVLGTIALAIILLLNFKHIKQFFKEKMYLNTSNGIFLVSLITVGLYLLLFFVHPHLSRYLVPAIPFFLIAFYYLLGKRSYVVLCVLLIVSSFILNFDKYYELTDTTGRSASLIEFSIGKNNVFIDPVKGPIFYENSRRENNLAVTARILEFGQSVKEKSVVIIGWWMPLILVEQERNTELKNPNIEYVYYPDENLMKEWQAKNIKVYYISDLKRFIKKMGNIDIEKEGAICIL